MADLIARAHHLSTNQEVASQPIMWATPRISKPTKRTCAHQTSSTREASWSSTPHPSTPTCRREQRHSLRDPPLQPSPCVTTPETTSARQTQTMCRGTHHGRHSHIHLTILRSSFISVGRLRIYIRGIQVARGNSLRTWKMWSQGLRTGSCKIRWRGTLGRSNLRSMLRKRSHWDNSKRCNTRLHLKTSTWRNLSIMKIPLRHTIIEGRILLRLQMVSWALLWWLNFLLKQFFRNKMVMAFQMKCINLLILLAAMVRSRQLPWHYICRTWCKVLKIPITITTMLDFQVLTLPVIICAQQQIILWWWV